MSLSAAQRSTVLKLARGAIDQYLRTEEKLSPPPEDFLLTPFGAFVSLKIGDELRGCIGMIEARYPLGQTIVGCAIAAATEDPRFPPLTLQELFLVRIEASLLSPLRPIETVEEIEVGIHGLLISLGNFRGLLLPQVALEYEWDRDQFLRHTCIKAGLPPDAWKHHSTKIEVFTAEVFGEADTEELPPQALPNL